MAYQAGQKLEFFIGVVDGAGRVQQAAIARRHFAPKRLVVIRLAARLVAAGRHVDRAITIAEIIAAALGGKNFRIDAGAANAGRQGRHDNLAVGAATPDAGDAAGNQPQHTDHRQRSAAFDHHHRVLPHLERRVAQHEDQVRGRASLQPVAGLHALLRRQPPAIEQGVPRQLHHIAARLRLGPGKAAHRRPGGSRTEETAALKPQKFGFVSALQDVLAHGESPGVASKQSLTVK